MSNAEGTAAEHELTDEERELIALDAELAAEKSRTREIAMAGEPARKIAARKRSLAAQKALTQALIDHSGAQHRVIVHPLPKWYGGAVICEMPSMERWREIQDLSFSKTREIDASKCNTLLQELLIHPSQAELSTMQTKYFPGLAAEVIATVGTKISAASNDEDQLGKS